MESGTEPSLNEFHEVVENQCGVDPFCAGRHFRDLTSQTMRNKRAENCVTRSPAAWLLLLIGWAPLLIWGQPEGVGQRASTPRLQVFPSSSNAGSPLPPESKSKSSERIFGVVPAYTITDARNAPPLPARQKLGLFAKGSLGLLSRGSVEPLALTAIGHSAGIDGCMSGLRIRQ
jgi:hypothetical protein